MLLPKIVQFVEFSAKALKIRLILLRFFITYNLNNNRCEYHAQLIDFNVELVSKQSPLELTHRKPFKWPYVTRNITSYVLLDVERSLNCNNNKKDRKKSAIEKVKLFNSG